MNQNYVGPYQFSYDGLAEFGKIEKAEMLRLFSCQIS